MALTARSIVTLTDLKEYLGIGRSQSDKDAMLEKWIDWVSGKFESEIENVVKVQEKTVYLDGSGDTVQYLPFHPVVALYTPSYTDVQYRSSADADWASIVEDDDLIHIDTELTNRIELLDGNTFPVGQKNIKIHYYAGHATVPGDIIIAIIEALQMMWNDSRQGGSGLNIGSQTMTTTLGSASISYQDATPRWLTVVRRYKTLTHIVELFR